MTTTTTMIYVCSMFCQVSMQTRRTSTTAAAVRVTGRVRWVTPMSANRPSAAFSATIWQMFPRSTTNCHRVSVRRHSTAGLWRCCPVAAEYHSRPSLDNIDCCWWWWRLHRYQRDAVSLSYLAWSFSPSTLSDMSGSFDAFQPALSIGSHALHQSAHCLVYKLADNRQLLGWTVHTHSMR